MTKKELKQLIESLAKSQGFYGRLLERLNDNPEAWDYLEQQEFTDEIDFILWLES